jgi:hypothetical protein
MSSPPDLSTFGFFPFGYGAFGGVGAVLWPPTYAPTNGVAACRVIVNGDYVLDSNGDYVGGDPVTQEVLARVATVKGTFVDASFGDALTTITLRTDSSATDAQNDIAAALQPMVDAGTITNLAVQSSFVNLNGTVVSVNAISFQPTGAIEIPS